MIRLVNCNCGTKPKYRRNDADNGWYVYCPNKKCLHNGEAKIDVVSVIIELVQIMWIKKLESLLNEKRRVIY